MVERRYRDDGEATPARGGSHLLERLRQRKTSQTAPIGFNLAPWRRRKSGKDGGRAGKTEEEREEKRKEVRWCEGKRACVCECVYQKCVWGQTFKRRRGKALRRQFREGGWGSSRGCEVAAGWTYRERNVWENRAVVQNSF